MIDGKGKFSLSGLRPGSDGKLPKPGTGKAKPTPKGSVEVHGGEPESEDGAITLHHNGDGTYKTKHEDGTENDHPHLGHALMHMAHHHEPDGKHVHVHHDGMSMTSHGIHETGEHDGPHDHENIEELKSHLGKFFNEEEHEGEDGDGYSSHHDESDDDGMSGGF